MCFVPKSKRKGPVPPGCLLRLVPKLCYLPSAGKRGGGGQGSCPPGLLGSLAAEPALPALCLAPHHRAQVSPRPGNPGPQWPAIDRCRSGWQGREDMSYLKIIHSPAPLGEPHAQPWGSGGRALLSPPCLLRLRSVPGTPSSHGGGRGAAVSGGQRPGPVSQLGGCSLNGPGLRARLAAGQSVGSPTVWPPGSLRLHLNKE